MTTDQKPWISRDWRRSSDYSDISNIYFEHALHSTVVTFIRQRLYQRLKALKPRSLWWSFLLLSQPVSTDSSISLWWLPCHWLIGSGSLDVHTDLSAQCGQWEMVGFLTPSVTPSHVLFDSLTGTHKSHFRLKVAGVDQPGTQTV